MLTHEHFYEQDNLRWNFCNWVPWVDSDAEAQGLADIDTAAFLTDPITGDITKLTLPNWYSEDSKQILDEDNDVIGVKLVFQSDEICYFS